MSFIRRNILQASSIPKDLDSVTSIDTSQEVDPTSVGLKQSDIDTIWGHAVDFYKTGAHPAVSLSIRHQGELLISRSIGHAHGNGPKDAHDTKKTLVTNDTPYCLFSTSKGITALLMHMLVEDGLINMMDPVSFYAPEFAINGKENITIHQILSHRGGIPGLPSDADIETLWDEDKVWKLLCDAKPIITDGSKLAYHAITGGFVLGQIVQRVTGKTINDYINEKIRKPMGMKYFSYGIEEKYADDIATNYHTGLKPVFPLTALVKRALGADLDKVEESSNDPRFQKTIMPAANLAATANEVSAFFQMMLNGGTWQGKRICSEETIARATQEFGARTLDQTLMIPMRYSAGLMLGDEPFGMMGPHSKHAFGHLGLINKFSWADPTRNLSVSLLNSGIPILGSHILPLAKLISSIGNTIPVINEPQTFSF
jgi:CubicO group peptidase (beta-lactamase class C family)